MSIFVSKKKKKKVITNFLNLFNIYSYNVQRSVKRERRRENVVVAVNKATLKH